MKQETKDKIKDFFKKENLKITYKEFVRYGQVRVMVTVFGVIWTTCLVDWLGWSGLATSLLWIPIIGGGSFLMHKWKGAKF